MTTANYSFKVKKSERGKSLENFIYSKMDGWSHKRVKDLIDAKWVFINHKNVFISKWNVKAGDRVSFTLAPRSKERDDEPKGRYHFVDVLFEDEYILVTNKPPFVDYDSFVASVNSYFKRKMGRNFHPYLGQMHRLDRETSGILLFTKKKIANVLADQFRNRQIKKYYLALVHGQVAKEHGTIQEKLEKKKIGFGKKVEVSEAGKESRTDYWVEERYEDATLLRILLGTGRTHQIRVHMAEIGHPIVGDKIYGTSSPAIGHQALHAHRVEFHHPVTKRLVKFEAPPPDDMAQLIDHLREHGLL